MILDAVAADGTALSSAAKRRRKMTTEASAMGESFGKYADYLTQLVSFFPLFFPSRTNSPFDQYASTFHKCCVMLFAMSTRLPCLVGIDYLCDGFNMFLPGSARLHLFREHI